MNLSISKALTAFFSAVSVILTGTALAAESADELIKNGDVCYAKLQAAEALRFYLPAEKIDPKNVRLLVHISREYRHLMSDAATQAEKRRLGGIAVDYAKRASVLGPNDADAQLAVAISYGLLQPLEGNRERIEASRIIKAAVDRTIRLDPNSDLGWHVLGRWHKALADVSSFQRMMAQAVYGEILPQSTYGEAATCFEKAIQLNPNRLMHYVELGRIYAQIGKSDDARRLITKGLAMQDTEKDDPETKRQGRELLAKLR
ncbi:MAG TPA: tetratricopeptide repeat protein, partial [Chthoniobacterales bacterium]|nr:tetratricopeptide repeat protein [Chthoniobacterales bacterium]